MDDEDLPENDIGVPVASTEPSARTASNGVFLERDKRSHGDVAASYQDKETPSENVNQDNN